MKSIGYTSELLEHIKRVVWASNSVIHLFNTPQPVLNLHSWKFIERTSKANEYEELVDEYAKMSLVMVNNKYKVLRVFMEMMKNAASAYESYGIASHAEFHCKQLLKSPHVTPQAFLKASMVYIKLNKAKCYPSVNRIMNLNESKSISKTREAIQSLIHNFLKLFPEEIEESSAAALLSHLIPLSLKHAQTTLSIPNKLLKEATLTITDYLLRSSISSQQEIPETLITSLTPLADTVDASLVLISVYKQLNLDYGKILKQAFRCLLPSSEASNVLNDILTILFNSDEELDKKNLRLLARNLSTLFALITGFTGKVRLLTLLHETVEQFALLFQRRSHRGKGACWYYMLYVCSFVVAKSRLYNVYWLWKFGAVALLEFVETLSVQEEYVEFFCLDECTFSWYPALVSAESIGIMHVSRLQHVLVEKSLRGRKSMDFGRQQAYYKLALSCFSSLNALAPDITSQRKRRSSLEQTLISLNEEVEIDFTGAVARKAKEMVRGLAAAFEAGYTVVVLNSNLAEIAADPRKSMKLYVTRLHEGYDPVFVTLRDKAFKETFDSFAGTINDFYKVCDEAQKNSQGFWFQCGVLDKGLKKLLYSFEQLLGPFKYLLLGTVKEERVQRAIGKAMERIRKKYFKAHGSSTYSLLHHFSVLFNGCLCENFTEKEVGGYVQHITSNWNSKFKAMDNLTKERISSLIEECIAEINEMRSKYTVEQGRNPLILILDSKLNNFPFESLPLLRDSLQPISRMPTIEHLVFACDQFNAAHKKIDADNAFFILNPTKDLKRTQQTFEAYFTKQMCWKGIIGKQPKEQEVFKALEESELFVYCGHGAGESLYSGEDLRKVEVRSSALLMGCSSSFFADNGAYENCGVALAYLGSGSPLVLGNLWDVTDRDIDRYLKALLNVWLDKENPVSDLLEAVAEARKSCKMKYLIGAAPVCYGIPIYYDK